MRKIDKSAGQILSTKYKKWVDRQDAENKIHNADYRYYYDDVVMNLYRCQNGLCAYTEIRICSPEFYMDDRWMGGRYKFPEGQQLKQNIHFGELEHFDSKDKVARHWNWDNLFMAHSSINGQKSGKEVVAWLKPDLDDYSPEKYFDYDHEQHKFLPNTDIEDEGVRQQIRNMIENVLMLNHAEILRRRANYINELKFMIGLGLPYEVNEFFTAVRFSGIDY